MTELFSRIRNEEDWYTLVGSLPNSYIFWCVARLQCEDRKDVEHNEKLYLLLPMIGLYIGPITFAHI